MKLQQAKAAKYMESTTQENRHCTRGVNKSAQAGWSEWARVSGKFTRWQ